LTFKRFYRFDLAVSSLFTELSQTYYGISVSAHLLSYTPMSVVQVLSVTEKPFFVDPMTFVFARSPDTIARNGKPRRSYSKLMAAYGLPFSECTNGSVLSPARFRGEDGQIDDSSVLEACRVVLSYQRAGVSAATNLSKYLELLNRGVRLRPLSPTFLVSPYFYARSTRDEWYAISLRCAQLSRTIKGDKDLYAVVCISRDILYDSTQVQQIIRDYAGHDGYIIWIDGFREDTLGTDDLVGVRALVEGLSRDGKPVLSMYGGFVCDLLSKFGLSGYSSGICYGESRSVDTKGGGAGNRYYVRQSHLKVSEELARDFFSVSDNNARFLCSCQTCQAIRNRLPSGLNSQQISDNFFTGMDFLDFRRHFMHSKHEETLNLESMTEADALASLDRDIAAVDSFNQYIGQPDELTPLHLRRWRNVFTQGR
jgi:hypothetical protein